MWKVTEHLLGSFRRRDCVVIADSAIKAVIQYFRELRIPWTPAGAYTALDAGPV